MILLIFAIPISGKTQEVKQSKSSYIKFTSSIGGIYAENSKVKSTLDTKKGTISFSLAITDFIFRNSLMQKHFNEEDVMNSENFPKARFNGKILQINTINYTKDGKYKVDVQGKLTIKGATKMIKANGTIEIKSGKIKVNSTFSLDRLIFGVDGNEESVSKELEILVKASF